MKLTVNSTQSDYHHATSECHRQSVPGSDEHAYRYTQQVTEQLHEILMTQHSTCLVIIVNQVKTINYTVNYTVNTCQCNVVPQFHGVFLMN